MSRSVEIFQVDAFTQTRFAGNPAGVVLDADGLDDTQMLALARELNNGDTAFVLRATGDDHDLRVRFFTPRSEAAFVGHATIAVHAVLATRQPRELRRQLGRTGVVQVSTLPAGTGFSIRQSPAPLGRLLETAELAAVLDALGLDRNDLDPRCPPRVAGSSSTRLLLGISDGARLTALAPDLTQLTRLSAQLGAPGYFVFSLAPTVPDCEVESRMFCPALGIPEDPVSGNAHGMLGLYLLEHRLLAIAEGQAAFTGAQGHHMGRPGKVDIALELTGSNAAASCAAVHIRGQAVLVFNASVTL